VSEIFAESLLYDGVQSEVMFLGVSGGALVQFHGHAHVEAPFVGDIRLFAIAFAVAKVFINSCAKVLLKLSNARSFIGNEVTDAKQATMEKLVFGAV